jgi:uncharacterized membrane protein YfcA
MVEQKDRPDIRYRWLALILAAIVMAIVPVLYVGTWLGALKYLALIAFFLAYAAVRSPLAPPEKSARPLATGLWMLGFILTLAAGFLKQVAGPFEGAALLLIMALALGEVFRPVPENRYPPHID